MFLEILAGTALLVFLVGVWLFLHRDPDFEIPVFSGYLSPASGEVCDIYPVKGNKQFIKKKENGITVFLDDAPWADTIVVIMMRPQDIHTQRAPVAGTITHVTHKDGTKKNAVFGNYHSATVENENVGYAIDGKKKCVVYAIAGLLARRIVPTVKVGKKVAQGERLGSIRFGSQVALVLPKTKLLVKLGDKVLVGRTKIAS